MVSWNSTLELFRDLSKRGERRPDAPIILEGRLLFERMIQAGLEPLGVVCTPELYEDVQLAVAGRCAIEILGENQISEVAGYRFHRGVLSAARAPLVHSCLDWIASHNGEHRPLRAVICPRLGDPANIGSIYRSAAGFGWDAVMVGEACTSPFGRKALRVSMGAALNTPTVGIGGPADLLALRQAGFVVVGAVLDDGACSLEDIVEHLHKLEGIQNAPQALALVLGHEYEGLEPEWTEACTVKATIPMARGHDSLNVALASGIFMYRLGCGTRD